MSHLDNFPSPRDPREEAALWAVRARRGLSAEEIARRDEWLEDPRNRAAFDAMTQTWKQMDALAVLADVFPLQDEPAPARARISRPVLAVAAVCCVMLGTLFFLAVGGVLRLPFDLPSQPRGEIYSTAVGQSHEVMLADGSSVTLNTDSEVEVRYTRAARDLILNRGEANFEVAKDPARPFNVRVGARILQAVGTAFNVRLRAENAFEVTVTEGKVKVLKEHKDGPNSRSGGSDSPTARTRVERTLAAHQTASVEAGLEEVRELLPNEIAERLAWQRGMVVFRGEPLEVVLQEFGRYTTVEFVLADESLRNEQVGGYFPVGQVDALLVALRKNFGIDSRRDGDNRIVLMRADP